METGQYGDVRYLKIQKKNDYVSIKLFLYIVDGLLIDCGPQSMEDEIIPFLKAEQPKMVAITHMHEDHCGMAAWIEQHMNIPIFVNPLDIPCANVKAVYPFYRQFTWGERDAFFPEPLGDIIKTDHYHFYAVDAPGHMQNHSVFFEEENGWLFTGDLYVHGHPRFAADTENAKALIASLEKILKLPFKTVFCAHAGILEDGRERIEKKLQYLLELQGKVDSMRARGMSDKEIDNDLFPDKKMTTAISEGEWASIHLIRNI